MFVREKQIGPYRYVYLVESVREGGRTKQRIIKNLGRKERVEANGDLVRLARSVGRHAERAMVLSNSRTMTSRRHRRFNSARRWVARARPSPPISVGRAFSVCLA